MTYEISINGKYALYGVYTNVLKCKAELKNRNIPYSEVQKAFDQMPKDYSLMDRNCKYWAHGFFSYFFYMNPLFIKAQEFMDVISILCAQVNDEDRIRVQKIMCHMHCVFISELTLYCDETNGLLFEIYSVLIPKVENFSFRCRQFIFSVIIEIIEQVEIYRKYAFQFINNKTNKKLLEKMFFYRDFLISFLEKVVNDLRNEDLYKDEKIWQLSASFYCFVHIFYLLMQKKAHDENIDLDFTQQIKQKRRIISRYISLDFFDRFLDKRLKGLYSNF